MLTKEQVEKLLNRSLTSSEAANFETYLKIAIERLEELLCMRLCGDDSERTYAPRNGYRTLYVDPFTDINSVTIDGTEVDEDDYTIKQNDRYSGGWYNSIEFDEKLHCKKVVVDADWGFDCLPVDLQLLLAAIFDNIGKQNELDRTINSKKIEDFQVSYNHSSITFSDTLWDSLEKDYRSIIDKYSLCDTGSIEHGSVRNFCYDRLHFS